MTALRPKRRRVHGGKQVGTRIEEADVATFELAIEHGLLPGPRLYTALSVALEQKAEELRAELQKRGLTKSGTTRKPRRKK
jgi:hypothetical protein